MTYHLRRVYLQHIVSGSLHEKVYTPPRYRFRTSDTRNLMNNQLHWLDINIAKNFDHSVAGWPRDCSFLHPKSIVQGPVVISTNTRYGYHLPGTEQAGMNSSIHTTGQGYPQHRTRRSFVHRRGELLQLDAVVPVLACRAAATYGTWWPRNGLHCFRAACLPMPQTRSPPIQSVGSTRWQLVLRAMRHMAMNAMTTK